MSTERPIYGPSVASRMGKANRYFDFYKRSKSEIQMDAINKSVPKFARVEEIRLHWKENNAEKLIVHYCPAKGFDFGPLPKEKRKVGKKTHKFCAVPGCATVLVKKTWSGWQA